MARQRLYHFDLLKGLAIFLVVVGHVLILCVRGIDRAPVGKFIGEIHMPLFFFISGWLAYKAMPDGQGFATPKLLPRAKRLLLPMIAASSLWILAFPATGLESPMTSTFSGLWSDAFKNGYWFTLVLFEIFVLYSVAAPVLRRCGSAAQQICVGILFWAFFAGLNACLPAQYQAYASSGFAVSYFGAFLAGVLASRHSEAFGRLCCNGWVCAVSLLIVCGGLALVCWPWKYNLGEPVLIALRGIIHIALAIVAIAVTAPWASRAFAIPERPTPIAAMWQYLGQKSLAIYLLHYFFLFPLGIIRPYLEAVDLAFVPLFAVGTIVGAVIICFVLCAEYVLGFCGPLALLFTGSEARPSNSRI